MTYFAHALIELEDGSRIARGDSVPDNTPGFDELVDAGTVSEERYDPENEPDQVPDYVEIAGVRYVKVSDNSEEASDAR